MQVTKNLLPADATHSTAWLPEKAVLLISTDDPTNCQYITVEVWDKDHNPIQFGQTDPAFGMSDFVRIKLQSYTRSLQGLATLVVTWADMTDQQFSETSQFLIA